MLFSLSWLRTLISLDAEASEIASALTSRGLTVDAVEPHGDDSVLDVDVPANRPDCLGHRGLARELGAAFGVPLVNAGGAPAPAGAPVEGEVAVTIADDTLCARYTAGIVRKVRVGPSPPWVVARLEACGIRSINNVVDASNLVLLELGHPIHTFDLARLLGAEIRVRTAERGEKLTTLDGIERTLDPEMLVIADAERPIALAGVMGGADTEISGATQEVLVEAAWFLPSSVRRTARKLGMTTDAAHRFERGVDPEGVNAAQELAARILSEVAGGVPAPAPIDVHPRKAAGRTLTLRHERVERILGYDPGKKAVVESLTALGLDPTTSGTSVGVRVPSWRVDLEREEDLVEEVARHLGYDRIPSRIPPAAGAPPGGSAGSADEHCRDLVAHLGFHETFNYAMLARGEDDPFAWPDAPEPMTIKNPIAESLTSLRRSILPGLLRVAALNLRRGTADVRLFEVGSVFFPSPGEKFPEEPRHVAIVWAGSARPDHWSGSAQEIAVHDIAGVVEAVLCNVRPAVRLTRTSDAPAGFHPGRSLTWTDPDGRRLAWGGEIHPDVRDRLDVRRSPYAAEIDLEVLESMPSPSGTHGPLPKVPAVVRDLSLVGTPDTVYSEVVETLRAVPAPAEVEFRALDRYEGPRLPDGQFSITVRVILQPLEQSLTEAEIESYRVSLVSALEKSLGLRLRS